MPQSKCPRTPPWHRSAPARSPSARGKRSTHTPKRTLDATVPPRALALPAKGVIHVWRASVPVTPESSMRALLSDEECARAERYVFPHDRAQFVVARGWTRTLIGAYLSCDPRAVRFSVGTQGKPVIDAPRHSRDLHFNVAHSGDAVLIAFAVGREVGIDVERVSTRIDPVELGKTCFSREERAIVEACDGDRQRACFFRYWSAKEAYIKLLGGGLSIPLEDFTVVIRDDEDSWPVETVPGLRAGVLVRPVDVPEGYAGAVASDGDAWTMELRDAQ